MDPTTAIEAYEIQLQQDQDSEFIKIIWKDQQELVYCLHDLTNPEQYWLPVWKSQRKLELKYSRDKLSQTKNWQRYIVLQDVFSDQIVQIFLIDDEGKKTEHVFTGNKIIPKD